jgi:hypothetical protein
MMDLPLIAPDETQNPALEFVRQVLKTIRQRLSRGNIARSALPRVNLWLEQQWNKFSLEYPGPWELAQGLPVRGLVAWIEACNFYLRWRISESRAPHPFLAAPRELRVSTPLGTAGAWTFTAYYEGRNTPRLAAMREGETLLWRLYQHDSALPGRGKRQLAEAMRRAQLVNFLAGTQWASPAPQGTLGVPYAQNPGAGA